MKKRSNQEQQQICLPEDLLLEIFTWLPAKSLMRFKCVSKLWNNRITRDSCFINRQRRRSQARSDVPKLLICVSEPSRTTFFTADSEGRNLEARYTHCSKFHWVSDVVEGLVCFVEVESSSVAICNLSTKQCHYLPKPNFKFKGLPCVPLLGFDHANMLCKVVLITRVENPTTKSRLMTVCEVFTAGKGTGTGTKSWRVIEDAPLAWCTYSSVSLKGVMYMTNWGCGVAVIAFDLSEEKFRKIPFPEGINPFDRTIVTQLDHETLALACLNASGMKLWKLLESGYEYDDDQIQNNHHIWVQQSTIPIILDISCRIFDDSVYYNKARRIVTQLPEEARALVWDGALIHGIYDYNTENIIAELGASKGSGHVASSIVEGMGMGMGVRRSSRSKVPNRLLRDFVP